LGFLLSLDEVYRYRILLLFLTINGEMMVFNYLSTPPPSKGALPRPLSLSLPANVGAWGSACVGSPPMAPPARGTPRTRVGFPAPRHQPSHMLDPTCSLLDRPLRACACSLYSGVGLFSLKQETRTQCIVTDDSRAHDTRHGHTARPPTDTACVAPPGARRAARGLSFEL
jgi:hypothetical protein